VLTVGVNYPLELSTANVIFLLSPFKETIIWREREQNSLFDNPVSSYAVAVVLNVMLNPGLTKVIEVPVEGGCVWTVKVTAASAVT
jgi:hypothetical protein